MNLVFTFALLVVNNNTENQFPMNWRQMNINFKVFHLEVLKS